MRRHARGVEPAAERVLRDQHEQGAAQRHDEMRAETGFLRAELTLEADHPTHQSAQKQAEYHFPINYHNSNIIRFLDKLEMLKPVPA